MKKRLLLRWLPCRAAMLVTLLGASLGLNAEDKFYISDFEIAAGESVKIRTIRGRGKITEQKHKVLLSPVYNSVIFP